ncbi:MULTISPECIES: hypothetical protein [unclassified Bradyrhizobium]|uniref:hypothetical protein n=1 Tax=unclassified Bradyrhizobium TaxID=2631580 RepID=UPI002FEF4C40
MPSEQLQCCAICPHQNDCRNVGACLDDVNADYLAISHARFSRLMTPAQATRCMDALKNKTTLRRIFGCSKENVIIVTPGKFRNHCKAYPEWGAEALRLAKENEKAAGIRTTTVNLKHARERSAESRRNAATCANGHVRTLENTFYVRNERNCLVRRCKDCNKKAIRARMPTEEQVRSVVVALHHGATLSAAAPASSQPALRNFFRKNPKIGSRIYTLSRANLSARLREVWQAKRLTAAPSLTQNNGEDAYEAVRRATAHLHEHDRGDVMSRMYIAIGEGWLKLSEASARVDEFLRDHRRRPRVYGDQRFSLDIPLSDEGGATWLDTKTDADRLWG